ncbi:MAG: hypothetical protein E7652_04280 [Ruminococcaceae bacterium]|nr:hypothetical protein [Oscillospiraceae bacterium]
MYSRIYPQNEGVPPNYKGNAFDRVQKKEDRRHRPLPEHFFKVKKREKNQPKELNSVQKEKSFALDDIILGGLIVLLLNSHADDELLIILILLFVVGL